MAQAYKADGIPGCLDEVFRLTKPYMPPYYLEEQRGLAAGSVRTPPPPSCHSHLDLTTLVIERSLGPDFCQGIPEVQFQRIAVMGELTKMGCTMLGAWGPASATGGLLQVP